MSTPDSQKTIVFDLDATAAEYHGWDVHGKFPGPPRPDFIRNVCRLREHGKHIGILSTRPDAIVHKWIAKYALGALIDFVGASPWQPPNAGYKPIAFCYIDDRAIRYDGHNMDEIVDGILSGTMVPWYKKLRTEKEIQDRQASNRGFAEASG